MLLNKNQRVWRKMPCFTRNMGNLGHKCKANCVVAEEDGTPPLYRTPPGKNSLRGLPIGAGPVARAALRHDTP